MALLGRSRVRAEGIHHTEQPLSRDTSACDAGAWARDNQGKHSPNPATVSSSTWATCVCHQGGGLTTHEASKAQASSAQQPLEHAANALNLATKIRRR